MREGVGKGRCTARRRRCTGAAACALRCRGELSVQGSRGWCSEGAVARVRRLHWRVAGTSRALNGKMSEASLMSCTSGRRRGNFSAHSSSAFSEIALKRSFFSGTAAAISIDASASDDTSMEASTSCIHTPAVARAARPVETGANVDSCSAVASALFTF